jgi:hypothetical protein
MKSEIPCNLLQKTSSYLGALELGSLTMSTKSESVHHDEKDATSQNDVEIVTAVPALAQDWDENEEKSLV